MTINLKINLKILFAALITVFVIVFAFRASNIKAQASSLSGSCGIIMNSNFGGWASGLTGSSVGQNTLGILNFDTGTFTSINNYVNNYGTSTPSETQNVESGKFVISAGAIAGTYAIDAVNKTATDSTLYILPVNGGNTFLITDATSNKPSAAGVCQKL
jgi:hypothetical protein